MGGRVSSIDHRLMWPGVIVTAGVGSLLALFPSQGAALVDTVFAVVARDFKWLYLLFGLFCVGFLIWLGLSPWGAIKLGAPDDEPEFSNYTWVAMMFCAGIGIAMPVLLLLLAVCIYGGFFNAGLGIIVLSYLALAGFTNINAMNGLKLLVSTCVSLIAIVLFIYDGVIAWYQGSIVLVGTLAGGYVAAHYSRRLPQSYVRQFVIVASIGITLYFFYDIYWSSAKITVE